MGDNYSELKERINKKLEFYECEHFHRAIVEPEHPFLSYMRCLTWVLQQIEELESE